MTRSNPTGIGVRAAWIAGAMLGGLVLAASATADWIESFDAGFSQVWTFEAVDDVGNPPSTGISTFEIVEAGIDDYLRISHSTTALRGGGGGATDGFGYVSQSFGDTGISADLNAEPLDGQQNLLAVIARGDPVGGTAYAAGIDFANSFFAIGRSDDFFDFLVPLVIDSSVVLDPNEVYRVQFFMVGSNLTARLTEVSTGSILSTISAVDFSYASGFAGVLVETEYDVNDFPVAPIIGTFDNVEAVPEPSLAGLIGWGVGMLVLLQRRRQGQTSPPRLRVGIVKTYRPSLASTAR